MCLLNTGTLNFVKIACLQLHNKVSPLTVVNVTMNTQDVVFRKSSLCFIENLKCVPNDQFYSFFSLNETSFNADISYVPYESPLTMVHPDWFQLPVICIQLSRGGNNPQVVAASFLPQF